MAMHEIYRGSSRSLTTYIRVRKVAANDDCIVASARGVEVADHVVNSGGRVDSLALQC